MAFQSGIGAQLGFAAETTWGTYAAPDHFLEFHNETLKNNIARMESPGLRAGNRVLRTDRWAAGKIDITGDVQLDVFSKGMLLLYKHMFGGLTSAADGAGFVWTSSISDPLGLGLTVQVGRPDTSGTVNAFSYTGCKVTDWELSNSVDNFLELKLTLDGQAESTVQSLASASYPTSQEPLNFVEGTITIAGASYNISQWNVSNTVGVKTDRYFVGSQSKKEQLVHAYMQPKVSFTAEFGSLTPYQLYTNGTLADIELTYTGAATYDTGKNYKVTLSLPNVRFDGATPNVSGPEVLSLPLSGVALYDGTNDAITLKAYTSEASL